MMCKMHDSSFGTSHITIMNPIVAVQIHDKIPSNIHMLI